MATKRARQARRAERPGYGDAENLRARMRGLIEAFGGSIEAFADLTDQRPLTVQSYVRASDPRVPSAAALYTMWRCLEISPTYVLTGAGPQRVLPASRDLRDWAKDVLRDCDSTAYATNASVEYEIADTNPEPRPAATPDGAAAAVPASRYRNLRRESELRVRYRFAPLHDPADRGGHGAPPTREAGVLALLWKHDHLQGGVDWTSHRGLRFEARASRDATPLILRVKGGGRRPSPGGKSDVRSGSGQHLVEIAELYRAGVEFAPFEFRFSPRRVAGGAFPWDQVRVLALAVDPALYHHDAADRFDVSIRALQFF